MKSLTDLSRVQTGDPAAISYDGAVEMITAVITDVKYNSDHSVRLVGARPVGTDHTAWFAPDADLYGLRSVGGSTYLYV